MFSYGKLFYSILKCEIFVFILHVYFPNRNIVGLSCFYQHFFDSLGNIFIGKDLVSEQTVKVQETDEARRGHD